MGQIKPSWVKYKSMGGPRYLGERVSGVWLHTYEPPLPWGVWTQILGVVARCEGRHDTVVMYDETGVTFGAFQWTFKSGRLQRLLQFFKSIPHLNFEDWTEDTLFETHCRGDQGQIFEDFGFKIRGGNFVNTVAMGKVLDPRKKGQRKEIVDICMGRKSLCGFRSSRKFALNLCKTFAELGQQPDIQAACVEYAKLEFKRALDVRRGPLKKVGGTIRCLLPDAVWRSPIPAIFFNLYQNSPGGSFRLFKRAMREADKKGLVTFEGGEIGYDMPDKNVEALLDLIWRRLCRSSYADWGFKSKQYIASGGKNPPRIKNIRPAIKEFYGIDLKYYK